VISLAALERIGARTAAAVGGWTPYSCTAGSIAVKAEDKANKFTIHPFSPVIVSANVTLSHSILDHERIDQFFDLS
jgi:hypothetical protein